MSESNALLQRLGGVPTLSSGGVTVANPLAAITAGNQAAQAEFETRAWQAKQAAGQAFQQSIDPNTGQPNQAALMRNLAADPRAALAAQTSAQAGQTLTQQDYDLQSKRLSRGADALGQLVARYPQGIPMEVAHAAIDQEVAQGMITPEQAGPLKGMFGPDRRQNSIAASQLYQHNMNTQQQLEQWGMTRQIITTPQGTYDYTRPPPGAGTVFTPHGPGPGETQESGIWVDANGNPVPQGTPGAVWQSGVTPKSRMPQFPQGGPPTIIPGPSSGGGAPSVTPPPPPRGNTSRPSRPPPGTQGSLTAGGVQVASANPDMVPATGTPGASSPQVAGDVAAIEQGMAQARGAPRPPGTQMADDTFIRTGPPQGQPEKLKTDIETFTADQRAFPNTMTAAQNIAHAYDALRVLKSNTGKGAEGLQALRSYAGTLGITSAATMKEQELVDLINKYTTKAMIDAANASGTGTDMARHMAESSNPGMALGNEANFVVMRNDLGLMLQKAAAYQEFLNKHPGSTGGGYPELRGEIAKTDPRGFVWNAYGPEEQARILAEVKDDPAADAALHKAIAMGRRLNVHVPGVTIQPPPPNKRSMLMPPPMPPGPQTNPLLMAG